MSTTEIFPISWGGLDKGGQDKGGQDKGFYGIIMFLDIAKYKMLFEICGLNINIYKSTYTFFSICASCLYL